MAQATYPVLTWATRSLFKMIEPYLVLLRVEFTLQPTITSGPVRSYRTLSPLPTEVGGLLKFKWGYANGFHCIAYLGYFRAPCFGVDNAGDDNSII